MQLKVLLLHLSHQTRGTPTLETPLDVEERVRILKLYRHRDTCSTNEETYNTKHCDLQTGGLDGETQASRSELP